MQFFTYRQNNSGGWLDVRVEDGVGSMVCIEATDAEAANRRAEELGITFDMSNSCDCCGERWREAYDEDGMPFPSKYDELIWGSDHRPEPSFIHYSNGVVEKVNQGDPAPDGWQQIYLAYIGYQQRKGA